MVTSPRAEVELSPPLLARVRARRRETHDTVSIDVDAGAGTCAPGQFNMLYAFGKGEVPISVSATGRDRITHTIREVGLVTAALADARPGTVIGIRGPFGIGWPMAELRGKDVIIVAGGLGLAPLRPAVDEILANRAAHGRVVLLYGARTPGDLLFPREVERWRGRFDVEVMVTVDAAPAAWRGDVGVVTKLFRRIDVDPERTAALVCGPEVMMRFAAVGLVDAGVPDSRLWLSMERNMQCGAGVCGHCQLGPYLVCRDGPVLPYSRLAPLMRVREL